MFMSVCGSNILMYLVRAIRFDSTKVWTDANKFVRIMGQRKAESDDKVTWSLR
jgi:hypothetical protein